MKIRSLTLTLAALAALTLAACSGEEAAKPAASSATPTAAPAAATSGIVEEVLAGDGYTYARVNSMGGKFWVAAPPVAVNVGEAVTLKDPTQKTGYKSAALNRSFDPIFFVAEMKATMPAVGGMGGGMAGGSNPHAGVPGAPQMGGGMAGGSNPHAGVPGAPQMGGGMGDGSNPHAGMPGMGGMGGMGAPKPKVDLTGIQKASGGYTVAELFEKKKQLSGKEVVVRGKVVKMSMGIMGSNWAHVRDGSGGEGTNDVTVTTSDMAQAGDLVVVRGLLSTDVDIGSGYFFPVLLKDAKVSVEKK